MKQLIECVPNFSEGRDMAIIKQITDEIQKVEGVRLLDVDPGKDTNRTVVTFVGTPDEVVEAAVRAMKKASELIDMRKHKGEHPRFGATDVCPLIPISNITMEETVVYARKLAERAGKEIGHAIFCYEFAAFNELKRNLASVRAGEYERLPEKLKKPEWKPDFGSEVFNERTGATAIGARNFLIAYNVNLNTTSTRRANAIAYDVREIGRVKREGGKSGGKILKDEQGNNIRIPGTLKNVKAIGWYIEEYGVAQISMNLTDITVTSIHQAFDAIVESATARGIRVTGSELVGLIPLQAMLDAGKYFLRKQKRSVGLSDAEIIHIAVKSLGLDELKPFNPHERIIEYMLEEEKAEKLKLTNLSLTGFIEKTASEVPAPGGGSISALMGTLGASLAIMVANLSSHKRGWDERWEEFSDHAEKAQALKYKLLKLVDEDTFAFNQIMEALRMPKTSDNEKKVRHEAIQKATIYAIEVPYNIMVLSLESMYILKDMAKEGLQVSVSDAGVGALAAKAAVSGAFLNVKINLPGVDDKEYITEILAKSQNIEEQAGKMEKEIMEIVNSKIV